jgi:ferric-dicitrate binding protein FerR (iron transport regulator)
MQSNLDEESPITPRGSVLHPNDPDWLRGRVLADEALNDARHAEVIKRLDATNKELAEVKADVAELSKQAPSAWEKRAAYFLAVLVVAILGKLGIVGPANAPLIDQVNLSP